MKERRNKQAPENCAQVCSYKADEDVHMMGMGLFGYFSKEIRHLYKISADENQRLSYEYTDAPLENGIYMYAIGVNGALYVGDVTVHSQFKAGKKVQSAGWIEYQYLADTRCALVAIDNCSGHYTPTLHQFLASLFGLYSVKYLPGQFQLKLSKYTKVDMQLNNPDFWNSLISDSNEGVKGSKTNNDTVYVVFSYEHDGFVFTNSIGQTALVQKREVLNQHNNALNFQCF